MSSRVPSNHAEEGAIWYEGALMTVKARGEATGGALGLIAAHFPAGFAPPLHVHHREDEALYVLAGELRGRRGQEEFTAGAGDIIFLPRGIPHTFTVQAGGVRGLVIITPGGFERFFEEAGVLARDRTPPLDRDDVERTLALAQRYGVEVVGAPSA